MAKQFNVAYLLLSVCISFTVAFHAHAAVYKWVDKDGMTHYSQEPPPPGVKGKTMTPPPEVNSDEADQRLKKEEKTLQQYQKQRQKQSKEQQEQQQKTQEQNQACAHARLRLKSFQRPRVNFVDKDGTRRRATEEQRQRELKKAQDYIDKNCQ
jgi:hypothetical protein